MSDRKALNFNSSSEENIWKSSLIPDLIIEVTESLIYEGFAYRSTNSFDDPSWIIKKKELVDFNGYSSWLTTYAEGEDREFNKVMNNFETYSYYLPGASADPFTP